ncbi:MAG: hypothetical protein QCI38_04430 [Candidatus Thermoplasmatota archaeon]|nr:hypothetical protein [Candidatus Thermoplasmatota archaeon]
MKGSEVVCFVLAFLMIVPAIAASGANGGIDDADQDDFYAGENVQPQSIATVVLPTRSGWLESSSNPPSQIENYNLYNEKTISITFTVTVEDSDDAHAETDQGSDPDTARITITADGQYQTALMVTDSTEEFSFGTSAYEYLPSSWSVEIFGVEFGGGKSMPPIFQPPNLLDRPDRFIGSRNSSLFVYVDQGLLWTIEVTYYHTGEPAWGGIAEFQFPDEVGWIDSRSGETAYVYYNLSHPNDIIHKVEVTVTINDSNEENDETDLGSDPDCARVTVSAEGFSLTQDVWSETSSTMVFETSEIGEYLPANWSVEIDGIVFGGGKPAYIYPSLGFRHTFLVYVDQGLEYVIQFTYWYEVWY